MSEPVTFLDGRVALYNADCREVLPTLSNDVDAVVTSPPYDGIRDYGDSFTGFDWRPVFDALPDALTDGGVVVWNVADQVVDGSETGTSFRQALYAMERGLRLHDTMIYCKEGVTFPDANRYHPAFEYVFVFSKGAPRHFNGIKDWKNKWGGSKMHGTDRQPDGRTTPIKGIGRDVPSHGLRRNWWVIANPYTGETAGHPAPMPYSLASDHIQTWTDAGETVLDPFLGSGTTGVACVKLGRNFIGIEIEPKYFDIACERIEAATRQADLFIAPAPKQKQEAFPL